MERVLVRIGRGGLPIVGTRVWPTLVQNGHRVDLAGDSKICGPGIHNVIILGQHEQSVQHHETY
jgi:hypothetical protein